MNAVTILRGLSFASALACLAAQPTAAQTDTPNAEQEAATLTTSGACGQTSQAGLKACHFQSRSDRSISIGTCANAADAASRARCLEQADAAFDDAEKLCGEQ